MELKEIISQAEQLINSEQSDVGIKTEVAEFLRIYAGEKSAYYKSILRIQDQDHSFVVDEQTINFKIKAILKSFINSVQNGVIGNLTIERKAKIEVVNDFLSQANFLLSQRKIHPATSCVLAGAALEEFLRNWIEELEIKLGNSKPSLDTYCKKLKEHEYITKQDVKDITAWAGLRNHAAHGEWDLVDDKKRIGMMVEGINLFIRINTSNK